MNACANWVRRCDVIVAGVEVIPARLARCGAVMKVLFLGLFASDDKLNCEQSIQLSDFLFCLDNINRMSFRFGLRAL